jgi:hypothetical protein
LRRAFRASRQEVNVRKGWNTTFEFWH